MSLTRSRSDQDSMQDLCDNSLSDTSSEGGSSWHFGEYDLSVPSETDTSSSYLNNDSNALSPLPSGSQPLHHNAFIQHTSVEPVSSDTEFVVYPPSSVSTLLSWGEETMEAAMEIAQSASFSGYHNSNYNVDNPQHAWPLQQPPTSAYQVMPQQQLYPADTAVPHQQQFVGTPWCSAVEVDYRTVNSTTTNGEYNQFGTVNQTVNETTTNAKYSQFGTDHQNVAQTNAGYEMLVPAANMSVVNMPAATIAGANMPAAYMSATNMVAANMPAENMTGAHIPTAYMPDANSPDANMPAAYMPAANMPGADGMTYLFNQQDARKFGDTKPAVDLHSCVVAVDTPNPGVIARVGPRNKPLDARAVEIMEDWFQRYVDKPYPKETAKKDLARRGRITVAQVNSWFANRRNRSNNTKPKKSKDKLKKRLMDFAAELHGRSGGVCCVNDIYIKLYNLFDPQVQKK